MITSNNTSIHQHGANTYVTLHATHVVTFDDAWVILRTGGYFTVTTKRRMNEASTHFDLGYRVIQQNYKWRVVFDDGREALPFGDHTWVAFRR